jgi:hypothetical protein
MKLTDMSIRPLPTPEQRAKIYTDSTVSGFGVRVTANGVKSFVLTHGPRRERETIGRVGILKLSDARQRAKEVLAEYTLGKQKTRSVAWDTAIDEFLEHIRRNRKPRTYADYKRLLKKHFRFGPTKLPDITPEDILKNLGKLPAALAKNSLEHCLCGRADEQLAGDSIAPGICMNDDCSYTIDVEGDQEHGWCENCAENTVVSVLILADVI